MAKGKEKNNGNLGFEAELFRAADKLRGNMEPSDYKHVALGLIFLKYISDAFEAKHKALLAEDAAAAEDKDEYLADNVFWVPKEARWSRLKAAARQPTIGSLIDEAMRAIEKDNESLKGVLPKDYSTFPTGAGSGCGRMRVGFSARRPWATPITPGFSTSGGTWPPTARRAWCSPMAR
jgi:type I restriction enzyme M protein